MGLDVPIAPDHRSRRRHARARLPATAILFTNRPLGPCIVEDISVGGLRLVSDTMVRRGRVLSALLDLPGGPPLRVSAQVARHETRAKGEHALALAFLDLSPADAKRVASLVAHDLAEIMPCLE